MDKDMRFLELLLGAGLGGGTLATIMGGKFQDGALGGVFGILLIYGLLIFIRPNHDGV